MTNRERQALIGGLIGVHLAVGPLLNYFGTAASPWESLLDYGILAGQVSVLGIWTVYGVLPINRRVGFSLAGLVYIWYWMVRYWSFPASFALGAFGHWFLVVALLLAWQAVWRSQTGPPAFPKFGLKELLLWTAMGAATLALAKSMGAEPTREMAQSGSEELLQTAGLSALYVAVGLAAFFAVSKSRRPLLKLLVLPAAAIGALLACLLTFSREMLAFRGMPLVVSALVVVCTLAAMRWLQVIETATDRWQPSSTAEA